MEHTEKLSQPERFRVARDYINKSQEEIESIINFSRTSISKHETKEQPKPSAKYILYLEEFGINGQWLVCKSETMLKENIDHSSKEMERIKQEMEQVKKEKSYLEKKIEKLEETVKQLMATVHLLSGKNSEHKPAAFEFSIFGKSKSYVPATN